MPRMTGCRPRSQMLAAKRLVRIDNKLSMRYGDRRMEIYPARHDCRTDCQSVLRYICICRSPYLVRRRRLDSLRLGAHLIIRVAAFHFARAHLTPGVRCALPKLACKDVTDLA